MKIRRPNKGFGAPSLAERVEGRGPARGNPVEQSRDRTQCRGIPTPALDRIRQAAEKDKRVRMTALWHHVYDVERLRGAYYGLNRNAAPGVDGETRQAYGKELKETLIKSPRGKGDMR